MPQKAIKNVIINAINCFKNNTKLLQWPLAYFLPLPVVSTELVSVRSVQEGVFARLIFYWLPVSIFFRIFVDIIFMSFKMKKILSTIVLIFTVSCGAYAAANVRFHNEATDTTRINEILIETAAKNFKTSGERNAFIARKFIATPYVAGTLDQTPELVTVNLDELDCTTFVDMVLAMSLTVGEGRTSWRDFVYNLERMRYRGGEVNGYASRLHYISDWFVDNIHRGNIEDATRLFPKVNYIVRTIDFMSSNRDKYPLLADDDEFRRIKNIEIGYRSHRFPYIKTVDLGGKETKAAFREGDAVALVSSLKNLDVSHMGFVVFENGEPYLLHASSSDGKVELSQRPLADYMKRNRSFVGLRIARLKN